jgi:hypothetical protein
MLPHCLAIAPATRAPTDLSVLMIGRDTPAWPPVAIASVVAAAAAEVAKAEVLSMMK